MAEKVGRSRGRAPNRPLRRIVGVVVVGVAAAVVASFAITWWEERPLDAAEAALDAGRPAETVRAADAFLRSHPGHGRATALKARALVAVGRPAEAIRLFESVGAARTEELHAYARALLATRRWAAARTVLEQVLRGAPEDADALHELAAAYANLGRYRDAVAVAERFAKRPGQEARGALLVGTLERDMGNYARAAASYGRVIERSPDASGLQVEPAEFFHAYGSVLLKLGRAEEAARLFLRSLAARPTPGAYADGGSAYQQLGRGTDAEALWRKALAVDPGNVVAREGIAGAALGRGDAEEALELLSPLEKAVKPRASTAYLLQRAYALRGDRAESERWRVRTEELRTDERLRATIDRAIADAPDSAWAAVCRAYQFAEQGNWDEARAQLAGAPLTEPFVGRLREAIENRGPLPDLADLPISRF